jgi:zinc transport system permease protein
MVLPVATARLLARSQHATLGIAMALGVLAAIVGLGTARTWGLAPGGTIVLVSVAIYAATAGTLSLRRRTVRAGI